MWGWLSCLEMWVCNETMYRDSVVKMFKSSVTRTASDLKHTQGRLHYEMALKASSECCCAKRHPRRALYFLTHLEAKLVLCTSLAAMMLHLSTSCSKHPSHLAAEILLLSTSIQKLRYTRLTGDQQTKRFLLSNTWLGSSLQTEMSSACTNEWIWQKHCNTCWCCKRATASLYGTRAVQGHVPLSSAKYCHFAGLDNVFAA